MSMTKQGHRTATVIVVVVYFSPTCKKEWKNTCNAIKDNTCLLVSDLYQWIMFFLYMEAKVGNKKLQIEGSGGFAEYFP